MSVDDARAAPATAAVIIGRGPEALRRTRQAIDNGDRICLLGTGGPATRSAGIASVIDDQRGGTAPLQLTVGTAARRRWQTLRPELAKIIQTGPSTRTGKLILVGGGPGPADLLTVRATRALAAADLLLVDRLAPGDDLAGLAPQAVIVDVGKLPGHHPVPQAAIEGEAVAHARAGATVVRLKGGDPFVFGRGGEELAAGRAAGVSVEVVPGISSPVAVPGAAGIPVTWRGISHGFTVISGHAPLTEAEYQHLVGLGTTIVLLMGLTNLPQLTSGLLRHGLAPDTPAAIIERGFHPSQRSTFSTVSDLIFDRARIGATAPAVVVIGDVVSAAAAMQVARSEAPEADPHVGDPHPAWWDG